MKVKFKIKLEKVTSVYSGIDGRCCCGCAGKHTYASALRDVATKARGYTVKDDEVNDRVVKLIVGKIERADEREVNSNNISAVIGKRLYVAYFNKEASA